MKRQLYQYLQTQQRLANKTLAVLVDPDKGDAQSWQALARHAQQHGVGLLLVGGSLLVEQKLEACVTVLKKSCNIPVVLFPGSPAQVTPTADGILLLSLISGRNPELLIGQHVQAAATLKASQLETLPTGYVLVDGGVPTTVSYISNTQPIPADKPEIAAVTALAGEQLGLKLVYLEAGSGAKQAISTDMIKAVRQQISIPLFVGGGIRTGEAAYDACQAGADVLVIGTAFEQQPHLLPEIAAAIKAAGVKAI